MRSAFRYTIGILSLAAGATTLFTPRTAAAQVTGTKVTYTVEFRTTGAMLDATCTATGTDVLSGPGDQRRVAQTA